ncbi:hypothetical protein DV736_g4364, partial [Chaetothyriales sp. CBS 134916]
MGSPHSSAISLADDPPSPSGASFRPGLPPAPSKSPMSASSYTLVNGSSTLSASSDASAPIQDNRWKFQDESQLPPPRQYTGGPKRYRAGPFQQSLLQSHKMPMQWTPDAMERLYLAILKTSDGLKYDVNEIAKYMGPNCTAKAVVHRISTVKNEVKELTADWDGVTGIAVSTNSRKRKRSSQDDEGAGNEPKVTTPAPKKTRAKVTPAKEEITPIKEEKAPPKDEL